MRAQLLQFFLLLTAAFGVSNFAHAAKKARILKGDKKKVPKKGGKKEKIERSEATKSDVAYEYQLKASTYLTEIDNIVNDDIEEIDEYYSANIGSMQTDDIVWDIDAGARQFQRSGMDEVRELWYTFLSREFGFHTWSHFVVTEVEDGIKVALRYHGVIQEEGSNYQDIFGVVNVYFDDTDLIYNVFVQRFHTIDRGYGP